MNEKGCCVHDDWTTWWVEYVASTYWTVTLSPALAAGPVPVIRSALSSRLGGELVGTVTVGCLPAVPAAERSATGMEAMAAAPVVGVAAEEEAVVEEEEEVVVVELGGLVVVELEDELLHPARPSAPTANRAIDQLQRTAWHGIPFRRRTGGCLDPCGTARHARP